MAEADLLVLKSVAVTIKVFFLRAFVGLTLVASALGQGTPLYELELGTVADRLTHDIQSARQRKFSPKALVIDFLNQQGKVTVGGEHLADLLSDALNKRLAPTEVLTRKQLREYLLSAGISPYLLQDRDVAVWTGEKGGANRLS